jgi:hypothetical protein
MVKWAEIHDPIYQRCESQSYRAQGNRAQGYWAQSYRAQGYWAQGYWVQSYQAQGYWAQGY